MHRDPSLRDLTVIAVNIRESRATVTRWIREKKVSIPILLDADGDVTRGYNVIATPTAFLIDRQGRVLGRVVGPRDWASPAGKALIAGLLTTSTGR
jgi:alkyl hydroperoxide reductase subunit AhpC